MELHGVDRISHLSSHISLNKASPTEVDFMNTVTQKNQIAQQYKLLEEGVGIYVRELGGFLAIEGTEALDLLNRISTNKLLGLGKLEHRGTVLPTEKGKFLDLIDVVGIEESLMIRTLCMDSSSVKTWLDHFIIMEDVRVKDISDDWREVMLIGANVSSIVNSAIHESDFIGKICLAKVDDEKVYFLRDLLFDEIVRVWMPKSSLSAVVELLQIQGNEAKEVAVIDFEAFEFYRLLRGIPAPGFELTSDFNPLEIGLEKYIDFNKGCYIGQEVIARLNTYQKVQNRRLVFECKKSDWVGQRGLQILRGFEEVGKVTSQMYNFQTNMIIGQAYLKLDFVSSEYLDLIFDDGSRAPVELRMSHLSTFSPTVH